MFCSFLFPGLESEASLKKWDDVILEEGVLVVHGGISEHKKVSKYLLKLNGCKRCKPTCNKLQIGGSKMKDNPHFYPIEMIHFMKNDLNMHIER